MSSKVNSRRKSLQVLQQLAANNKSLTRDENQAQDDLLQKSKKTTMLDNRKASTTSLKTSAIKELDNADEVKNWLTEPSVDNDPGYWKALAEERRSALESALEENQNL